MSPLNGQGDPFFRELAEDFKVGDQRGDFRHGGGADKPASELSPADIRQFDIRTVPTGVVWIAALAAWLATGFVLAGETAGVESAQGQKPLFKLKDFFIDLLHCEWPWHIYRVSYI
ncbi:MAG TPA: hypothetical protein VF988_01125 [Verrucomicrobiae bacterium]